MSEFDDLEPDFIPSPGVGMLGVADRVYAWHKRRRTVFASAFGVALFVVAMAYALDGGDNADKLTVVKEVTTTAAPSTTQFTLSTTPQSSSTTVSSTTVPPSTSTSTTPVAVGTTTTARPTTTTTPGRISVVFAHDELVIKSGTTATVSYTVTNEGDGPAHIPVPGCLSDQLWPRTQSRTQPVLWPVPVHAVTACTNASTSAVIAGHTTKAFNLSVLAGQRDTQSNDVVPAPPGKTRYLLVVPLRNISYALPVTITAPDSAPITVDHPSEITTRSGRRHSVDFTITNNLPYSVRFVDQGPCSSLDENAPCRATTLDGIPADLRFAPYATAVKPLYRTGYVLAANETRNAEAEVNGTTTLDADGPFMPLGVYAFAWDGEKVKFTVTP